MEQGGTALARVLVVEDDPAVRRLVLRLLEEGGYAGVPAEDADQARDQLSTNEFELMLCDVALPGQSGLDLIREILAKYHDIAVVMVTVADDPKTAQVALDLGAYGYVTKPFRRNELLINIANALRRRSLELENRMHREGLEQLLEERTATLRRREAAQRAVANLGERALYGMDLQSLFDAAVALVREHLGVPMGAVLQLSADRGTLVPLAAKGYETEVLGISMTADRDTDAGLAVATEEPVRFVAGQMIGTVPIQLSPEATNISSSLSVVIRSDNGPYGAMVAQAFEARHFTLDDVSFTQSIANILGHAVARARTEEQLREQALRDPLTGLPNRAVVTDRLEFALARSARRDAGLAVLFVDLDHFKTINDSLGHRAGDQLLTEVARRLTPLIRSGDTLARFGGDEFVLLCEELPQPDAAVELARRLGQALEEPFRLGTDTVFVTASIGIALASEQRTTAEALIRDADAAVYLAKDHGRGRYEFFDATLRNKAVERMRTETALRWALEREELVAYYQPIVDIDTSEIVGIEALARWLHPEEGLLLPDRFVPLSEETGLIVPLGDRVLTQACRQLVEWIGAGAVGPDVAINVNVSARQLANPQFADFVATTLSELGLPSKRLQLEITESTLVDGTTRTNDTVRRLRELGIGLVLDDFGTGYSSLGYIQRFPLTSIKLDRAFVAGLSDDETQRALVAGITSIARALGLTIVLEGIETHEQATAARELGCRFAQGYLFARPAGADTALRINSNGGSARSVRVETGPA